MSKGKHTSILFLVSVFLTVFLFCPCLDMEGGGFLVGPEEACAARKEQRREHKRDVRSKRSSSRKHDGQARRARGSRKDRSSGNERQREESLAAPSVPDAMDLHAPDFGATGSEDERAVRKGTLGKGEDAMNMFQGASPDSRKRYLKAARDVFSRGFQPGHYYTVVRDGRGQVRRFEYEIDKKKRLVVEGVDQPMARLESVDYSVLLANVTGMVQENIFDAVANVGETPRLATLLVEIFGNEINFLSQIRTGDTFTCVVEKRYQNGCYYGYGRILAAVLTIQGRRYEAYLYPGRNGEDRYYNEKGENLRRAFLQQPLSVTHISSGYSMSRMHPVLGYSRPHEAIDYSAPTGTPVKAVGDGTVTFRGRNGAYGNQIVVRHAGGIESWYSHLSGYARGLAEGSVVTQGQVIGFVGSTGRTTGPHLDFRIRKGDSFINPAKLLNPRQSSVKVENMKRFTSIRDAERQYLQGRKSLSTYDENLFE